MAGLGCIRVDHGARQLVGPGREGHRQVARRIDLAGQHAGDGFTARGAGIPGFQHRADVVPPRHQHRAAGLQYHDGLAIGLGHRADQGVLVVGQAEVRRVDAFTGPLGGEDDDHIGLRRGPGGRGGVLAVDIGDRGLGALFQSGHRRGREIDHRPGEAVRAVIGDGQAVFRTAVRIDLGGAATRQHAGVGMAADDQDRARRPGQGQKPMIVLQQDDGALFVGLGRGRMAGIVYAGRLVAVQRMVEQAFGEHRTQDAVRHLVEPRGLDPAIGDRLAQGVLEIGRDVERIAGFLVESAIGRGHRRVGRAPVRHDIALEAPVGLQHLVEQPVAFAGIGAVDAVVRTHDRARLADLVGQLERQQVRLPRRLIADLDVDGETVGLLVVEGIVLQGRDDIVRLNALDLVAIDGAGQQRVLAAIFEIAAVPRLTRQVDAAGQLHVKARHPRFIADHRAAGEGEGTVPGRRRGDPRRQGGAQARMRRALGSDADAGVGFGLSGNPEAGNARNIAGGVGHAAVRSREMHPWRIRGEIAEDELLLFLGGHDMHHHVGARIRIERGVHPQLRGRRRGRGLGQGRNGQAERGQRGGQDQVGLQRHGRSLCEGSRGRTRYTPGGRASL